MLEICFYCQREYEPQRELGRWSCRYHPQPAAPDGRFLCCGVDVVHESTGGPDVRRGCTRCDHTPVPWSAREDDAPLLRLAYRDQSLAERQRPGRSAAPAPDDELKRELWRESLVESPPAFFDAVANSREPDFAHVRAFMQSDMVADALRSPVVELVRQDAGRWRGVPNPPPSLLLSTRPLDYRLFATAMRWIGNEVDNPRISESYLARRFFDAWSQAVADLLDAHLAAAPLIPHYVIRRRAPAPTLAAEIVGRDHGEHAARWRAWRDAPFAGVVW